MCDDVYIIREIFREVASSGDHSWQSGESSCCVTTLPELIRIMGLWVTRLELL